MVCIFSGVLVLFFGGLAALACARSARLAGWLGQAGAVLGCGLALVPAAAVLAGGQFAPCRLPWSVPLGSFSAALDPLSAVFALLIAGVSALAAVYGGPYLAAHGSPEKRGAAWFHFNLLVAGMILVVVACNAVLFLMAWEIMSLASFFLVMSESEKEEVRRAGWTYLVAAHLGTLFLLALFALAGRSGSLDFDGLRVEEGLSEVAFVLALIGFGTKAGLVPLHVWLPEAHPAAPSHVSAVMSGVMIKTGIYGLLRTVSLFGTPPAWCGWTLLAVGAASGILGVLLALAQHDLKRLLAYHSVENIGIIAIGLGLGLLGIRYDCPAMAALGLAGGLLHVANHALFKSLLFLGAGAVLHATGTRDLDRLGGLLKRMPQTGLAFLVGAAAITGLPPLNGFISELLIYLAAFSGLTQAGRSGHVSWVLLTVLGAGSLALIGGLAAACFTKAFGVVFLGEPRTSEAGCAREAPAAMRIPMLLLAAGCAAVAAGGPLMPAILRPAVESLLPAGQRQAAEAALGGAATSLAAVGLGALVVLVLVGGLVWLRRRLLRGRIVTEAETWDCGYAAPSPRMQYTASSFAWPLVYLFRMFIGPHAEIHAPSGLFPADGSLHTHTPDLFRERLYRPLFAGVAWVASGLRWLQQGRIQLYVLYIALTLLALLVWKLG